jgi:hypothetical protein
MLNFTCTTLSCLHMYLGVGTVLVDDGQHLLYTNYKVTYACSKSSTSYSCSRIDRRYCSRPLPSILGSDPFADQLTRHQFGLACR